MNTNNRTPRLAPLGSPTELTYALIGETYGAMRQATTRIVRDGTIDAYVDEHAEQLANWLDSDECVIPANLRALGSAAVTAAQAFVSATTIETAATAESPRDADDDNCPGCGHARYVYGKGGAVAYSAGPCGCSDD